MNKEKTIKKYFHKIDKLTLQNKKYLALVDELVSWLLDSDEIKKDLTTISLDIDKNHISKAYVVNRKEITLAGVEEAEYLLRKYTKLKFKLLHKDSDLLKAGEVIMELKGNTSEILSHERVILNILQRFSGIATETNFLIRKLDKVKNKPYIAATRKTNWGLLDKKAVALGGGLTHRLSLSDGVLVKDNHLLHMKEKYSLYKEEETVGKTLEILLKKVKNTLIEIEVEKKESIHVLIEMFNASKTDNVLGILLDNFSPKDAKKVLEDVKQKYDTSSIIFEASGGITGENIVEWGKTGVDIISLGALTHSSQAADISLDY